ncbi:MAG: peptide deformylase [Spirochaetales bacterium]|nr:peptide deformylase [Spirochaetales bacterium]
MSAIITLGDERLKKPSVSVSEFDEEIRNLIDDMFEIMAKGKGIGLASVQIGLMRRLFVCHIPRDVPRIFINPEIIETSMEQIDYEEGCLSIPGINSDVIRPMYIKIQAWNEKGRPFTIEAEGLLARVIQHELDHVNGILFIDRLEKEKKEKLIKEYWKKAGV